MYTYICVIKRKREKEEIEEERYEKREQWRIILPNRNFLRSLLEVTNVTTSVHYFYVRYKFISLLKFH